MSSYRSADIKCPLYRRDDPRTRRLSCEGLFPGSLFHSVFRDKVALDAQIDRFCAGDYKTCPWYAFLLNQKYTR